MSDDQQNAPPPKQQKEKKQKEPKPAKAPKEKKPAAESEPILLAPILLNEPLGSDEMLEIERRMLKAPLFDDLWKNVPMLPLLIAGEGGAGQKILACCEKFSRCCYLCWNWLVVIFCYPCALCCNEIMRLGGYCMYYFWVIPARDCQIRCCHPCIDCSWRCLQPQLVACIVFGNGMLRPCVEILGGCIADFIRFGCMPFAYCARRCRSGKSS